MTGLGPFNNTYWDDIWRLRLRQSQDAQRACESWKEMSKANADNIAAAAAEKSDVVNPSHYTRGKIQPWDFIIDQGLDYLTGSAVKYIARHGHKGDAIEDLKKAIAFIQKRIEVLEGDK